MESKISKFKITSDLRLPFEPKGEALSLRNTIKEGIKSLDKSEYTILEATLTTNEIGFFDVENVLFYNVGAGSFSHLEIDELHFSLKNSIVNRKYEYSYRVVSEIESPFYNDCLLLNFSMKLPKLSSDLKPAYYWILMHQSEYEISKSNSNLDKFGLLVELELEKKNLNLTSVIKPILDGIISALHYQENPSNGSIEHISSKYNLDSQVVRDMFSEKPYSILGKRELISEYRTGIKWNPADEKCVTVVIKQKISDENRMNISVFAI